MSSIFRPRAVAGTAVAGVLLLTGVAPSQAADDGWTLYGSASGDFSDGGTVVLTENERYQAGIALRNETASLAAPVTFRYRLEHTGASERADGSAFILLNEGAPRPTGSLPDGGYLGISGLEGIAVVFDTWRNYDDPSDNYVGVVDMAKGLGNEWLIPGPESVWQGAVANGSPMDIAITVDRLQGVLEVAITYDARGERFSSQPTASYQFWLPASLRELRPSGEVGLAERVHIGFSAATGSTSGGHSVIRYFGKTEGEPVNTGLRPVVQELVRSDGIADCPPRTEDESGGDPPPGPFTSEGASVHTLDQSIDQKRTVHLIGAVCRDAEGGVPLHACSGVLVSPDLVLTAKHCTDGPVSGVRDEVPISEYLVTIGAILTTDRPPRVVSSGGHCRGHTLWTDETFPSGWVTGDLALVRLSACDKPRYVARLGGARIDSAFAFVEGRVAQLRYVGYPGDKPDRLTPPHGADAGHFPSMWSSTAPAKQTRLPCCEFPEELFQYEDVIEVSTMLARGASGGPFFGTSLPASQPSVVVSVAAKSDHDGEVLFTFGSFITPETCASMWSAAVQASLSPPSCIAPREAPERPSGVMARAGKRSAEIFWESRVGIPSGSVLYTVTARPGGKTCTTVGSSCTIKGLTPRTRYRFSVKASNPFGTSPASIPSSPVIPTR